MIYAGKKEDSRLSAILALVLHAIIFLLIFFCLRFELPDPRPSETYAELAMADFGYTDTGSGNNEGAPTQTTQAVAEQTPEEAVVDESSDVATNVQDTPSPSTTPTETAAERAERKRKEKEAREAKEKADRIAQMMNGGGDGNDNTGGNVGVQSGKIDGKGVFGNGTGSYSLSGRGMVGEPKFQGKPRIDGTVSVFVYVNKSGKVTKTTINVPGTNTTDTELRELAMKMARTATFNSDSDAKTTQRGTITFQFKVK
ncbi:MAG: hypothetical protein AB8B53_05510 [Flavobacteriales bacterium]